MIDGFVCNTQIGVMNHTLFLPDGTTTSVPAKDFAIYIVALAHSYENYSVKLVGHPAYTEGLKRQIEKEEIRQYNRKLLNIQLIGGNK